MNKVEGSTEKTTTITNAREKNKIVTLPSKQRNINEKTTSKLNTLDREKKFNFTNIATTERTLSLNICFLFSLHQIIPLQN